MSLSFPSLLISLLTHFRRNYRDAQFPGYEYPLWEECTSVRTEARALAKDKLKTIALTCGVFTPWMLALGVDWEKRQMHCVGSPAPRIGMTSFVDIARALARLVQLALADPRSVPDDVRIGGQFVSIEGIREAVRRVKGVQLEIEVADAQQVRAMLKANYPPTDPMAFVHYAMCAAYVLPGVHEY